MKTICIDSGHGGLDNGASYGFVDEDDTNLSVAYLLRCCLERYGFEVFMTRESDVYIGLQNRCDIANTIQADLFVSLHCDAFHNETVKGISTHIHTNANVETEAIADDIHMALIKRFHDHTNRGLKKSGFYVLNPKHIKMPSVLVECEFLSNPKTRSFLKEPENQFAIANTIADAIKDHYEKRNVFKNSKT